MSYASFWLRGLVSATHFTVVGTACKLATVLLNCVVWNKHASAGGLTSLVACILASSAYRQAPMREGHDVEALRAKLRIAVYGTLFACPVALAYFSTSGLAISLNSQNFSSSAGLVRADLTGVNISLSTPPLRALPSPAAISQMNSPSHLARYAESSQLQNFLRTNALACPMEWHVLSSQEPVPAGMDYFPRFDFERCNRDYDGLLFEYILGNISTTGIHTNAEFRALKNTALGKFSNHAVRYFAHAAFSGEHGDDKVNFRVTDLPSIQSLWAKHLKCFVNASEWSCLFGKRSTAKQYPATRMHQSKHLRVDYGTSGARIWTTQCSFSIRVGSLAASCRLTRARAFETAKVYMSRQRCRANLFIITARNLRYTYRCMCAREMRVT
jgi:hypothetical protein